MVAVVGASAVAAAWGLVVVAVAAVAAPLRRRWWRPRWWWTRWCCLARPMPLFCLPCVLQPLRLVLAPLPPGLESVLSELALASACACGV